MSQAATPARNSKKPFLVIPQDYKLFPTSPYCQVGFLLAAMPFPETFLPVLLPMPWLTKYLPRIVLEKCLATFRAEAKPLALGQQYMREQSRCRIRTVKRQFYVSPVVPRHEPSSAQCSRGHCR